MSLFHFVLILVSQISTAWSQETATPPAPATVSAPTEAIVKFCTSMDKKFEEYNWGKSLCDTVTWNHVRSSHLGTPLIWTVFGDENSAASKENTTLIMCGVHGDEITPVKFCWDLMNELKLNHKFDNKLVILVPLVSPDSFFIPKPTRTNGRGVDVNRNFPTSDWKSEAHKRWKHQLKADKRKNPGPYGASEQETVFQMNLILRYKPNKVISVHAPLTMLDYDGPSLRAEAGQSAKILLEQMSQKASGYKVSNYPIFPGSLGNWAGKEKHIPTYTLELPNSNPLETEKFWTLFKDAVIFAIDNKMKPTVD
jgi:protein MpaA